ncbi:MAG TPA: guanylate kinase [Firmicutes bacterium]|nr:MAG: guanylate kinase [Candidatus Coatesbacteria bacterium]HDM42894.1 guanylate kinase [Bacillota bacterium]
MHCGADERAGPEYRIDMEKIGFNRKNIIFVVSGPSGVGKTVICKRVLSIVDGLEFSVSTTSRSPREGEIEGIDYYFVSNKKFNEMIDDNMFIEYAVVHGKMYGTTRKEIERVIGGKKDALLDIDTQGAEQIKNVYPSAVLIFIVPPDFETLKERILKREGTINADIKRRLEKAREEIAKAKNYEYIVVNKELEDAVISLKGIIRAERCSTKHLL